jgi:hypothetical protein
MPRRLALAIAWVIWISSAGWARAQVCVSLDEARDNLAPEDRRAAVLSLMQALTKNGQHVVADGCGGVYRVYHVKLGATISVYLYGPRGDSREARASKLDELPLVYEQLVRALLTGQPMGGVGVVDRTNATSEQIVPRRVAADDVKYLRLGYGTVTGGDLVGGPAFGFGWRFELDRLAIDVSALNLIVATANRVREAGLTGSFVQLSLLYFGSPLSDYSSYFGAGVSWGGSAVTTDSGAMTGSGLQGNAIVGFEMFRSSTIRLFVQGDAVLPFYRVNLGVGAMTDLYTPSFSVAVGTGWGRSNTLGVVSR